MGKTESFKKIAHKFAKKLKNYEESVAKKQIEPDNQGFMNCLCSRRGMLL